MQQTIDNSIPPLPARDLLRVMELSREGDRREGILLRQGQGWFQVSARGHEALGALAYLLRGEDVIFPYYRDRAIALARGVTNRALALAYLAKRDSASAGRQMPGHYCDRTLNIYPVATPVASECLPAVGAAWAAKLDGKGAVCLCTIGDGALRQGDYYEAICLAAQWKLPLIMVVEDNGYAISTPTALHNPYRLGVLGQEAVARVDGRDPYALYAIGAEAVAKARRGDGPTVLWCDLDRLSSHTSSDDQRVYRCADEIAQMAQRDPVDLFAQRLIVEGLLTEAEWAQTRDQIVREVEQDYLDAMAAPDPQPDDGHIDLYAPPRVTDAPPVQLAEDETIVGAIRETLAAALSSDPKVVLCGEDIEDPKGGVFGFTKGLSSQYPDRVINAPLAESSLVGGAIGLAAAGYRPVFEIQFIDFLAPGFNQLLNQAATLRWRSAGQWRCPMVLIAPCGAYLPAGGPWHSQTHEGVWAHIAGLRVVEPSNPQDAVALLWTAIQGDDPTLMLAPKHIMRKRGGTCSTTPALGFAQSAVVCEGADVTLVTWGNGVGMALDAADRSQQRGIGVEVIDLRTIAPCDWSGIARSLAKTGRLVVLHEDSRTCGFGQAIVAEVVSQRSTWEMLYTGPRLVTRADTHIPFAPVLEYGVLPTVEDVLAAINEVMA